MTKEPQFEHSTKHWPIKHPDECVLPEIMGPLAPFDPYNCKGLSIHAMLCITPTTQIKCNVRKKEIAETTYLVFTYVAYD